MKPVIRWTVTGTHIGSDIWVLPLEGAPQPVAQTQSNEDMPRLSPDGRFLAYMSDEQGSYEVYVQPYPEGRPRVLVSSGGCMDPIWSRSGDALFCHNTRQVMIMAVEREPLLVETPRVLFEGSYLDVPGVGWDVAPDGRFLLLKSVEKEETSRQLSVVVNWFEELKRLAPLDN